MKGKKQYQKPELVKIQLKAEEALLTNCKIAGGAGPGTYCDTGSYGSACFDMGS